MVRREILRRRFLDICPCHETKPWAFELMIGPPMTLDYFEQLGAAEFLRALDIHYGPVRDLPSLLRALKDKNIHVMLNTNADGWIAVLWDNNDDGTCQGLHYGQANDPAEATRIAAAKFAGITV